MLVHELIEWLSEFPPHLEVVTTDYNVDTGDIIEVPIEAVSYDEDTNLVVVS